MSSQLHPMTILPWITISQVQYGGGYYVYYYWIKVNRLFYLDKGNSQRANALVQHTWYTGGQKYWVVQIILQWLIEIIILNYQQEHQPGIDLANRTNCCLIYIADTLHSPYGVVFLEIWHFNSHLWIKKYKTLIMLVT